MVGVQTLSRKSDALEDALGGKMRVAFDTSKSDEKFSDLLAQLRDVAKKPVSPETSSES
ncbi:hypothetical protein [Pontivivens ytuae]|uniref:Uncharacterized protein n=1 Tax=Pontivivens ytuae TaxID=2789856 RepID=A0A7S9QAS4_9RHOB|nr:hypothetical protein [Pontivivens ytuae]QPH52398.1 hypothetical protein I0K15_11230 [Pontivivens ytuae]